MHFTIKKIEMLVDLLKGKMISSTQPIDNIMYIPCDYTENNCPPPADAGWEPHNRNLQIGGKDIHFWMHTSFKTPSVPENFEVQLRVVTGHEGTWDGRNPQMLVFVNGEIRQGMDLNHTELLLEPEKDYDIYFYLYMGMMETPFDVKMSLEMLDKKVEKLYYDLRVGYESGICYDEKDDKCIEIFKILNQAAFLIDFRGWGSSAFYESVDVACEYLEKNLYNGKLCHEDAVINCVGSTHLDVAWMWTLAQTREKAQRSFATVLNLMRQYPEYIFMSSQPQLYQYVKDCAPSLYEGIKQRVKEGRWEIEGAMWLEADCNLTSGESLVRQLLHGKRFMKQEFGVESRTLWLPDVFGYSGALPQLLKKSGVDRFVTSKISWNEYNKFPYDTFMWQGIDGTEIFSNFITSREIPLPNEDDNRTRYNGRITPSFAVGTWRRYQQRAYNNEAFIPFGFGDGGGGPTKEMLEMQRRMQYGLPGVPRTNMTTLNEYLDKVEKNFEESCREMRHVPRWIGELYFELHRGTYTTMARNKKWNRQSELLYQRTEVLSSIASMLLGKAYPQDEINSGWKTILLNQFHDILPGSSIFEVYEDSMEQYLAVLKNGGEMKESALRAIAGQVQTDGGVMVFNPHSKQSSDMVEVGGKTIYVKDVPAMGWKVMKDDELCRESTIKINGLCAESNRYRLQLNKQGDIISLYDKANEREIVAAGKVINQLRFYENYPYWHDAWDISCYYQEKMWLADDKCDINPIEDGVRKGFELLKTYSKSTIRQKIWLYDYSDRIDFETEVDWQEDKTLLKAAFPVAVHPEFASYDIQFGSVQRPVHRNTSWDEAKFEVCGQKWADISEDNYGVSILNDCKYGYSVEENEIMITLLTAQRDPNPHADKEVHNFTYSIYPHLGPVRQGGTIEEAEKLNRRMEALEVASQGGLLPEKYSLVECCSSSVILETVKRAEDSEKLIMRMYQSANVQEKVTVKFGFIPMRVCVCNLMENEEYELEVKNNSVNLPIKGFEVVTLSVEAENGVKA